MPRFERAGADRQTAAASDLDASLSRYRLTSRARLREGLAQCVKVEGLPATGLRL